MDIKDTFKFCPRCGASFIKKDNYLACSTCGLSYYINPKPTTALVLYNEKNEFLLVERAFDPGKGLLDTPGGFVDDGETFEESAHRELKEELNIEVGELQYITSTKNNYPYQGVDYSVVNVVFLAKIDSNVKITPADDVASYKFYPMDNLPVEKFAFESMKTEFEQTIAYLAG